MGGYPLKFPFLISIYLKEMLKVGIQLKESVKIIEVTLGQIQHEENAFNRFRIALT